MLKVSTKINVLSVNTCILNVETPSLSSPKKHYHHIKRKKKKTSTQLTINHLVGRLSGGTNDLNILLQYFEAKTVLCFGKSCRQMYQLLSSKWGEYLCCSHYPQLFEQSDILTKLFQVTRSIHPFNDCQMEVWQVSEQELALGFCQEKWNTSLSQTIRCQHNDYLHRYHLAAHFPFFWSLRCHTFSGTILPLDPIDHMRSDVNDVCNESCDRKICDYALPVVYANQQAQVQSFAEKKVDNWMTLYKLMHCQSKLAQFLDDYRAKTKISAQHYSIVRNSAPILLYDESLKGKAKITTSEFWDVFLPDKNRRSSFVLDYSFASILTGRRAMSKFPRYLNDDSPQEFYDSFKQIVCDLELNYGIVACEFFFCENNYSSMTCPALFPSLIVGLHPDGFLVGLVLLHFLYDFES